MLQVENLMVFFENALALNDLSLKVEAEQIVGVIGSNSAGKTTLMNTLSGLIIDMRIKEKRRGGERITVYGKVTYQGKDITETRPSERVKRGIVLCRERHPVFPESHVLENLKIAGYLRRGPEVRQALDYVFKLFPTLVHLKPRKAGFLSGGEQQMLAIGRALMSRPKLIIFDEPTEGLQPSMVLKVRETIKSFFGKGITALIADQNLENALELCDRAYVLEKGVIKYTEKRENLSLDLLHKYLGVTKR
jgi:branched-chain amino acid transport system ATP-binding protein